MQDAKQTTEHVFAVRLNFDGDKPTGYDVKMEGNGGSLSLAIAVLIDQVNAQSSKSRMKILFDVVIKMIWLRNRARKAVFKSRKDRLFARIASSRTGVREYITAAKISMASKLTK